MAVYRGKRIVFVEKGKVDVLPWEVEGPAPGRVILQNVCSLISPGTELSRLYDTHSVPRPFPQHSGYASAARVLAVGEGVEDVGEGDLVLAPISHISHAEAAAESLVKIPDTLRPDQAVFALVACVGLKGIRQAWIQIGDSVLVMGLGLIGQFAQMFARLSGAVPVVGVDLFPRRLEIAQQTGLKHALNGADPAFEERLRELVPEGRFRVTVDSSGTPNVIAGLPARTDSFGTIVVLGGVHRPVELDLYTFFQKSTQRMIGAGSVDPRNFPYDPRRDKEVILRLMQEGVVDFSPLLTHRFPPEEAPEAYRMLQEEKNECLGVLFTWE